MATFHHRSIGRVVIALASVAFLACTGNAEHAPADDPLREQAPAGLSRALDGADQRWAVEVRTAVGPGALVVTYAVDGDRWSISRRTPAGVVEEHLVTPDAHWFHLGEVAARELGVEPVWVRIDGPRLDALPPGTASTLETYRVRPDRMSLMALGDPVAFDSAMLREPTDFIDVTEFDEHLAGGGEPPADE